MAVNELRILDLEGWRRQDEPVVEQLARAAEIDARVRKLITDRGRYRWSLWQKIGAGLASLVVTADTIANLVRTFH